MVQKVLLTLLIGALGFEIYILTQRTHFFIDEGEAHNMAPLHDDTKNNLSSLPKNMITIHNVTFDVWVAQTAHARSVGLSNQESLRDSEGMLFSFEAPGIYPFWMKDTKIPLDIIWILDDTIVEIATLPAQTNPDSVPASYTPKAQANYAFEINAGLSKQLGFEIGTSVAIGEETTTNNEGMAGIPSDFYIDGVPFAVQAPFARWYDPYEEACEEAAILMAVRYFEGKQELSAEEINTEILKMVDYEVREFGHFVNSDVAEIAKLLEEFYNYTDYEIVKNGSLDDIKRYVADGNLVILPAEGRLLKNPYFVQPGPVYHTVVIHGYDDATQEFIAHDPGTSRGADFRYSYATIENAWHDWTGNAATILQGERNMLVIKK